MAPTERLLFGLGLRRRVLTRSLFLECVSGRPDDQICGQTATAMKPLVNGKTAQISGVVARIQYLAFPSVVLIFGPEINHH